MKDTLNAVERVREAISELPQYAAEAVWDEVPSTSPFGMALRQGAGADLVNHFQKLSPEGMSVMAERLIEANKYIGNKMEHTADLDSALTIINGIADMSEDEQQFAHHLESLVPVFPGRNAEGEPMAFHHLYEQKVEAPGYDPISQARQALQDDPDGEDADYWWSVVHKEFPDLRGQPNPSVDDIPLSGQELAAADAAAGYNRTLGEGAGKVLQSLGYSNRSGMPEDDGVLTLEKAQALNAEDEANTGVIDPGKWAENQVEVDPNA